MAPTAMNSLLKHAEEMNTRHTQDGRPAFSPPAVAGLSPLHEILILEVAAGLPDVLAARLKVAPTVGATQDWLAAGAVFHWARSDPSLERQFLRELGDNPKQAGLALARALAAREPPARDAAWKIRDQLGLAFQLFVAGLFLFVRGLLLTFLNPFSAVSWTCDVTMLPRGIAGVDLLTAPMTRWQCVAGFFTGGLLWLCLEVTLAPRLMEYIRQLPAYVKTLPPPLSWRLDTFYVLWFAQVLTLASLTCTRCVVQVVSRILAFPPTLDDGLAVFQVLLLVPTILYICIYRTKSTLKLGTAPQS